jgi:hypothetical protein
MIRVAISEHINATADRVRSLYNDPENWGRLFPATIRRARVLRREANTTEVEVAHIEGRVINLLSEVSLTRIDLTEFKRRYDATFINEFIPAGQGTVYRLTGSISLKWPYRLLEPFLKALVISRMRRFIVQPLKTAVEQQRQRY